MIYALAIIGLYLFSLLWMGVISPWLIEQIRDHELWSKEQDELRRERHRERVRREKPEKSRIEIGNFLKFIFPIIRRTSPALIAQNIVSVQPMTGPIGGIAFYGRTPRRGVEWSVDDWNVETRERLRETYGRTAELDLVAHGAAQMDREFDRSVVNDVTAESIVRSVFQDNPYSRYYVEPRGAAHV